MPTAQQIAISFRKRDARIIQIRKAAREELRADELKEIRKR